MTSKKFISTVLYGAIAAAQPLAATAATVAAPADGSAAPSASDTSGTKVASGSRYRDGSFVGPAYDAYYGLVQVRANIAAGQITSIDVLRYPSDRRTSRAINAEALPMLESEVVDAQSGNIDMVSGATLTSTAYIRSLGAALKSARRGTGS